MVELVQQEESWSMRQVIVLGATAGLGLSTLQWLADAGAVLVLHSRDSERLVALTEQLGLSAERVAHVVGDVTDETLGERLWQAGKALPGSPFGWLSFVGIPGRLSPDEWTPQALASIFAVNCSGPLLACRAWAQHMKAGGHPGNAVLFSTMQACYPFEKSLPYSLGKMALQGGVSILAKEFGGAPFVRINAVAPGVNEAGMALASIQRGKYEPYVTSGAIPRYGHPDDLKEALQFLLSPSLYMTGQTMLLDGGLTLRRDQM
jgi:NAD(P)-dependent dehydrogenase (short-subunit alcohol dehydrogenase family)